MIPETNFGAPLREARIGNPLLYARRVLICVIGSFFASKNLLCYTEFSGNPWQLICNEDGTVSNKSKIFITDRYSEENVAKRPQIVIGRGTASWGDLVIGDHGDGIGAGSRFDKTRQKVDTLTVPIELSVYSQSDIEAENIAWALSFCIKAFEEEIRAGSLIFKLESTFIGPTEIDKISDEYEQFKISLQTTITFSLKWQKSTTLTSEDIAKGFCNASGKPFPMTLGELCFIATPKDAPDTWE